MQDERDGRDRRHSSVGSVVQFRRRHSSHPSVERSNSSIISRSSIFRRNFRPASVRVRDYTRTGSKRRTGAANDTCLAPVFEDNHQAQQAQNDTCLTPAVDCDLPLLIEEYHQLCRIVFLHRLEDVRDAVSDPLPTPGRWFIGVLLLCRTETRPMR